MFVRVILLVISFFKISILFASEISLDTMIQKSLDEKRVEGYVASGVYKITREYDKDLSTLLNARGGSFYTLSFTGKSKTLATYSKNLIESILNDLWNKKNLTQTLNCIRFFSFASEFSKNYDSVIESGETKESLNHFRFFKLCTQSFYHSKTLLGMSIMQHFFDREYDTDALTFSKNDETGMYTFNFHDDVGILANKIRGGQFGGVFTLNKADVSKKYFVKSYYGYPAKANFNSRLAFEKTTSSIMTSDIVNDRAPESPYERVNFKELFVYKFLELIGLGPKVHFLVNPYIKDGLFISTEDVNTDSEKFVEIGKINQMLITNLNYKLQQVMLGNVILDEYKEYNAIIDMLEIDTINRIFTLNDFNTGNFGYLMSESDPIDAISWLKQTHKFRVIDFLSSIKSYNGYVVENIGETFLEGNAVTKYDVTTIMHAAINRKTDGEAFFQNFSTKQKQELAEKNKVEKLFFGKKIIERLETERFKVDLNEVLQKAKIDVLEFFKSSVNGKIVSKTIGLSEDYIGEQINDLDTYIGGIITNYNALKEFIENCK